MALAAPMFSTAWMTSGGHGCSVGCRRSCANRGDRLAAAIGELVAAFTKDQRANYFKKNLEYEPNQMRHV
jgi:hypothetical protein